MARDANAIARDMVGDLTFKVAGQAAVIEGLQEQGRALTDEVTKLKTDNERLTKALDDTKAELEAARKSRPKARR